MYYIFLLDTINMNQDTIEICGQSFDRNSEHFIFEWPFCEIKEMSELAKLKRFPNLKSASFGSTNLNDSGLNLICKNLYIENLNLQDTQISNSGIIFLSQLKELSYLRLKENYQLDNDCIAYINNLKNLIDLQIHETSINQNGFKNLNLPKLKNLIVNEGDKDVLISLSCKLPQCTILAKGKAEFLNGKILWER